MQRIPLVAPEDLEGELAEAFKGPSGKSTFFRLMAQAPTAFAPYRSFIQAIFARLELAPVDRELVVLLAMDIEKGEYEWAQHEKIAEEMSIPRAQIEAIQRRAFDEAGLTEKQAALLRYAQQVVETVRVDDATFDAAAKHYSPRELVETIFTIGNYMLLARISEVARLPLDDLVGIESLREAEAKVKAEKAAAG
jgi:alkylhydroperoxidase family enzyme